MVELSHKKLDVYKASLLFVNEVYIVTSNFPSTERFGLAQQLRRAAVSVVSNIAEGSSRRSVAERNRYFEIARGSLTEVDAQLEVSRMQQFISEVEIISLENYILRIFQMLSKMIK